MKHGDLNKHLRGRRTIALKALLGFARDVASGLWYLHVRTASTAQKQGIRPCCASLIFGLIYFSLFGIHIF